MAVAFDEMNGPGGDLRPAYEELSRWLKETPPDALEYRRQEAELLFRRIGITFAVYGDAEAQERLIPFDVIPRIMSAKEWTLLEKGLKPLDNPALLGVVFNGSTDSHPHYYYYSRERVRRKFKGSTSEPLS